MNRNRAFLVDQSVRALFLTSGACGLIYQVVWTRKLALLFGTASYAVSTVLCIFFLGLALGSLYGGPIADRIKRPLRAYGLIELAVAALALLSLFMIDITDTAVTQLMRVATDARVLAIGVRAFAALLYLGPAVLLMGATLPLLARFAAATSDSRGKRIGLLYAINTFGAVAGCALAGFLLLPDFGYTTSLLIGVLLNVFAGLGALALSSRVERESDVAVDSTEPAGPNILSLRNIRLLLAAFALSGFSAIALEVLWTRMLTLVFIGSTFAYTTMLCAILTGIAAGSMIAAQVADRTSRPAFWYGVIQSLVGVACIASLAVFAKLPELMSSMRLHAGGDWGAITRARFTLSFAALLAPTLLFGAAFPFVIRALTQRVPALGARTGTIYSVNTFGGVIGALAGGFLIIPALGVQYGVILLASVLCVSGIVVVLAVSETNARNKAIATGTLVILSLAAGFIGRTDVTRALNATYVPKEYEVLHYKEGAEGTVLVAGESKDNPSERGIWINAVQATMSIHKGVRMNRFQGVLPMLFDHDPKRALFMCFGSGVTCGTLAQSPFDRIDAVELSRDVLDAAPLFQGDNLDVLHNPRVVFHIDDGRNVLLTSSEKYDVITFEPMPLAVAGVSTFYTREYYELCLDHLAPKGIVSQWIPLHSLSVDLVRDLTATFTSVFPHYCAWFINSDLFLTGSNAPLRIDYDIANARLTIPELVGPLQKADFPQPMDILGCFLMDQKGVDAFAQGGRVMTDDHPWAEFEAPKLRYQSKVAPAIAALREHMTSASTIVDTKNSEMLGQALERRFESNKAVLKGKEIAYAHGPTASPEDDFIAALTIDPTNEDAQVQLRDILRAKVELQIRWEEFDTAKTLLDKAATVIPGDATIVELQAALDTAIAASATADN